MSEVQTSKLEPHGFSHEPEMSSGGAIKKGFTLVEMLVSIAVLALLVVFFAKLANDATMVTLISRKHMDADAQARMVFDRMANDFGAMVVRKDVDVICKGVVTTSGSISMIGSNDAIYFFSQVPAYFDNAAASRSSLALVGYRINPTTFQLERLGKGLTWDGAPSSSGATNGMVFKPSLSGTSFVSGSTTGYLASYTGSNGSASIGTFNQNFSDGDDADFHVLGEGVYRFEYCFLLKPYADASGLVQPSRFSSTPYDTQQGHTNLDGWRDVAAIVVAIAVLDPASWKAISDKSKMVAALCDAETGLNHFPPYQMTQTWGSQVAGKDINGASKNFPSLSGIPQSAASQVRIYQRIFYLNHQ